MSIGFLLATPDDAVIWRGPKKNGKFYRFSYLLVTSSFILVFIYFTSLVIYIISYSALLLKHLAVISVRQVFFSILKAIHLYITLCRIHLPSVAQLFGIPLL